MFTLNSKNPETDEQHIMTNKIDYTIAIGIYSRIIFEHARQFRACIIFTSFNIPTATIE